MAMFRVVFTLDYEIHGNGDGDPRALMVEPTGRLLDLFERYGAKLTIMADIAEILKFREYKEKCGHDDYSYEAITGQLQDAIRRGHDVQLHIHSSYFKAQHERGHWRQEWSEYNLAALPLERLREIVKLGKEFLEALLQPADPSYRCYVFRAANWSVHPSRNIVQALVDNGIQIDTSIFKYGYRDGLVNFDYSDACSRLVPWKVDDNNFCASSDNGRVYEFPIYCEDRWFGAFLTPQRIYRTYLSFLHRFRRDHQESAADMGGSPNRGLAVAGWRRLWRRCAWKADFNQCTGRQLVSALRRAEADYGNGSVSLPFVLIGHSKLFTRFNEWNLRPFLAFVAGHPDRFRFARFSDFDLAALGRVQNTERSKSVTRAAS